MLQRNIFLGLVLAALICLAAQPAQSRAIRLDSGDWDSSGFISGSSSESIGFNMSFLGVTSSTALISSDGSLVLGGGGETATFNPFFDVGQQGGGHISAFQFGVTNGNFATPGVEAGFRVSWFVQDSLGAIENAFQLSMFELTGGIFAVEFNYDQLLFGSDASSIGYSTSLGDSFDLVGALGLSFAEYSGRGDDAFTNNCAATPLALACNNYFAGAFGAGLNVLPDTAGGFFRQVDSNGAPVQGRYLFLSDVAQIPEPGTLALVLSGMCLLIGARKGSIDIGSLN